MKKIMSITGFFALVISTGAINVPSSYDETTGKWVGNVIAFTNALTSVGANGEIVLAKGEYDVSFLADAPMYGTSASSGYGLALLRSGGKQGVVIRGATGNPQDVVIDGKGAAVRVIALDGKDTSVQGITIRGGNAGSSCAQYNYRHAGGLLFDASGCFVSNCIFTACWSAKGGGAVSGPHNSPRGMVLDSVLFGNATDAVGGGAANGGGAIAYCTLVSGCTVVSNTAGNQNSANHGGGGIASCATVTNCYVAYNYAEGVGGGIFKCAKVLDSIIEHNAADETVASDPCGAGGVYGGEIYRCKFRDNSAASVCNATYMEGCEVVDGRVNCLTNVNCVFRNLHNASDYVWSVGNVHYPDGRTGLTVKYGFYGIELMRGCLISECTWMPNGNSKHALFDDISCCFENCTIADNHYQYLVSSFTRGTDADWMSSAVFVNCAIVRNTLHDGTTASDVPMFQCNKYCFSNCVWNVTGSSRYATKVDGYDNGECTVLGVGVSPKFVDFGDHPYTPKLKSPLVGGGMRLDWMDSAVDLADNPRLREGRIDIGCYECWLNPVGFSLSIR